MLPDVALLEIFDFYLSQVPDPPIHNRQTWITLVHVCRKWRDIAFGSPRRLNLRLLVTSTSSVRKMLDTWPPPMLIDIWGFELGVWPIRTIIAALEHDDRIRLIELFDSSTIHMEKALAAMRKPFPELIGLSLQFFDQEPDREVTSWPAIPDSFLGESAPRLRSLRLICIPFPIPALRKLVLSATDLVRIRIWRIPDFWYISPEEIIACISTLTRLEDLELGFQSRDNVGGRRRPPSTTRCVLPALTSLQFKGIYEYMEDLMARIDAPRLDNLKLFLFDQHVLDAPQLARFIGHIPQFKALEVLRALFDQRGIFVSLPCTPRRGLQIGIFRGPYDAQLSALVELCTSESSFLRTLVPIVKRLYIFESRSLLYWLERTENSQWLELLRPFTAVRDLYLSKEFAMYIVSALLGFDGEGTMEVLPALRNFFLERIPSPAEPFEEITRDWQFVAAGQLSRHQIAVSYWDVERDKVDKLFDHEDGL